VGWVTRWGPSARSARTWESIAQRSQRPQRGEVERGTGLGDTLAFSAKSAPDLGKDRTKVTEGIEVVEERSTLRWTAWLAGGNDAKERNASYGQLLAIDQAFDTVLKACFTEID
jgi:hypothetical protein